MRAKFILILILLLFAVSSAFAGQRGHPQFEIEISSTDSTHPDGVIQGTTISVPIIVSKATHKISGFDFVIDYNISALTLIDVQPGSYLEHNNWELLEYEFLPDTIIVVDTICPAINIRGSISDDNNPISPPANIKTGDTLAIMNFHVTCDLTYECQTLPIEFFWGECRDNIIYSWPREKIFHASKLFNPDDSLIFDFVNAPPPYNSDCIYSDSNRGRGFNKRAIDYKNGRVKIVCMGIDDRGDINLNGIAYEVADAVIFTNYFMIGLDAFTIHVDAQTAATDICADGIPLTVEDLVYLIRVMAGEISPHDYNFYEPFSGMLQIQDNNGTIEVTTKFEKEAGAVHLCFYAPGNIKDVTLGEQANDMNLGYIHKDDTLKILVYSFFDRVSISPAKNLLLNIEYTGTRPTLEYASAAGYLGEKIDLQIIDNSPFAIKIGRLDNVYMGLHSYLPVIKTGGNSEMYSFDFLIGYDNTAMALMGAFENPDLFDMPGEYEWEYFTYRFVDNCGGSCPSGLLQFVGIANQKSNSHYPKSFDIPNNTTLFTLDFFVLNDYTLAGEFLPVSFFWKDCSDNAIRCKGASGNPFGTRSQVALSNRVFNAESRYDNIYYEITDKNCGFPTLNGTQEECYDRVNSSRLDYVPYTDFYNGGMKIIGCEMDDRGDVNLNGIAYEVADAWLFTQYFIYGLEAFTIHVEGQTAATDINNDGVSLTVEDLVFLIRVIVGDVLPYSDNVPIEHFSGTLQIGSDENSVTVGGVFEKAIGAVHLCFYAPDQIDGVKPTDAAMHMSIKYAQKNDSLKILIYSFEHNSLSVNLHNFVSIEYTGDKPVLAYASVGGHKSEKVLLWCYYDPTDSPVQSTLPVKFALHQNYPNPFNPDTKIKFSLPRSGDVTLEIFDITGRKVMTLINKKLPSGPHSVIWNGRDGAGRELSTGIYLYRLSTGKYSDTKKMLLLK